jgi:Cdc6-like AAA superfamily ATPase
MIWTQPETISNRFRSWAESVPNWETAEFCRERTARFLHRITSLRQRLGMPLIVAMLGGTGTGKSTLLNALLNEHVVEEGKERPTTAKPILVCHETINPETWGIDLSGIQIVKRDLPALEQMVILDCPDPDTTENDSLRETNLARLRAVLPLCDVLLVTATQQKYRSRRVLDELASASPGARLVFVQTHADRDTDIRDDWSELLKKDYETGRIFFIDSVAALKSQQNQTVVSKEFADLQRLLTVDLNEEAAIRIRQANFFSLAVETVEDCRCEIIEHWAVVGKLRDRISEERRLFGERLAEKMRHELISDRRLWESRLVGRVASQWGYSPFSILLRIYQGLGAIFSGALLTRVRSVPQLALWGAFEGIRSFRNWANSRKAEKKPDVLILTNWEEDRLRESALVLVGFATDARIPTESCTPDFVLNESKQAGNAFITSIAGELETICNRLASRNNRWWVRIVYELLLGGMLIFLLLRPAKNFFIDTLIDKHAKFYGADFYIISIFWLIMWGILLLGLFIFTLRRGLNREINETSAQWSRLPALERLFESIERETNRIIVYRDELETIHQRLERINQQAEKLDRRLGRKK